MGAVPHRAANDADKRNRSGLSPAVISSWAPTPLMALLGGAYDGDMAVVGTRHPSLATVIL